MNTLLKSSQKRYADNVPELKISISLDLITRAMKRTERCVTIILPTSTLIQVIFNHRISCTRKYLTSNKGFIELVVLSFWLFSIVLDWYVIAWETRRKHWFTTTRSWRTLNKSFFLQIIFISLHLGILLVQCVKLCDVARMSSRTTKKLLLFNRSTLYRFTLI